MIPLLATTTGAPVIDSCWNNCTRFRETAPVTTAGALALGDETLLVQQFQLGTVAITANSVLSLTGVSATGATGEENSLWGLIVPDQVANWIAKGGIMATYVNNLG